MDVTFNLDVTPTTSVEIWQGFCRPGRRAASLAARAADGGTVKAQEITRGRAKKLAREREEHAHREHGLDHGFTCEPGRPAPPISEVSGAGLLYRCFEPSA